MRDGLPLYIFAPRGTLDVSEVLLSLICSPLLRSLFRALAICCLGICPRNLPNLRRDVLRICYVIASPGTLGIAEATRMVYNAGLRNWRAAMVAPSFSQVISVCSRYGVASFAAAVLPRTILSNCENVAGLTAILRLRCPVGRRQNSRDPHGAPRRKNSRGPPKLTEGQPPKTKVSAQEELGPEQLASSVDMGSAESAGRPLPDSTLK